MVLRIVSGFCLLLMAVFSVTAYGVSLYGGLPEGLPERSIANDVHGIAPGLNDGATPVGSEYIPGEFIRELASNRPDTPGDGGGIPNGSHGNGSISELVKEIAPGLGLPGTTPVGNEFSPGELIREIAKGQTNPGDDGILNGILENQEAARDYSSIGYSVEVFSIPEPSLLIVGLSSLVFLLKRRKKA